MSKTRNCHVHGTEIGAKDSCPDCLEAFANRPNADGMTPDARVAGMDQWCGILEVPFDLMHERIEELVGRPVWTHEMASSVWSMLVDESRDRPGIVDLTAIMEKVQIIKTGMPSIPVIIE